jgi:predicted PurR-regulated permease PerM
VQKNPITLNRESIVQFFFFGTFAWLIYQLFLLSRPFLPGLLYAAMLVIAFHPVYARLRTLIHNRTVASCIMTLAVICLAVLPVIALLWLLFREADRLVPLAQELIEDVHKSDFSSFRSRIPEVILPTLDRVHGYLISLDIDLKRLFLDNVRQLGLLLTASGTLLARHALFALFNGIVLMIMLFFGFKDGERTLRWVVGVIPLRTEHKEALMKRAYETFRAVMIGTLATAAAQGCLAMVGFLAAGVKLPVLLGVATAFASLLGGAFIVTVPVSLWLMNTHTLPGIFLLIWSLVIVGLADNFLKPILIGSRARLPFVLIFFSILGGLKLYGAIGFILGPVLVVSVLTFLKIYQEEY